ncbi:hypothetical protein OROMI_017408 [Orobanche minor]
MADRCVFLVSLFCCIIVKDSYCYGHHHQFLVGGRDGWVLNPSEIYNHWAERNRFQVNDTLLFKYKNGSDSVLVVNKKDYYNCNNTGNPILKLENGNSVFKFEHSGPFYFISGIKANCEGGQKLIVVVLAVRNRPLTPPPTAHSPTAPPPKGSSPSPPPTTGSPAPGISTPSPSPSGGAHSPASSPSSWSPSPATGAPSPAGSPWSPSPEAKAPAISNSGPSPAAGAPGPSVPISGMSPASGDPGPAISSSGQSPSNASPTTPVSPNSSTPGTGTPADGNSPGGSPRRSFASPPCRPSILFASLVLSVGLGGFAVSN